MNDVVAVLRRLLDRLPRDQLSIDGRPYMRRYYLAGYAPNAECTKCDGTGVIDDNTDSILDTWCPTCDGSGAIERGWWWKWPFGAVRVHEILASDDQRAFHDHPWPFLSIGLAGSYTEERPSTVRVDAAGVVQYASRCGFAGNDRRTLRAPWLLYRRATDLHSLTLRESPVWSLVVTAAKQRTWGFADTSGWVSWRDFDLMHPGRDAPVTEDHSRLRLVVDDRRGDT